MVIIQAPVDRSENIPIKGVARWRILRSSLDTRDTDRIAFRHLNGRHAWFYTRATCHVARATVFVYTHVIQGRGGGKHYCDIGHIAARTTDGVSKPL